MSGEANYGDATQGTRPVQDPGGDDLPGNQWDETLDTLKKMLGIGQNSKPTNPVDAAEATPVPTATATPYSTGVVQDYTEEDKQRMREAGQRYFAQQTPTATPSPSPGVSDNLMQLLGGATR